jgi:DNA-binding FrmR family transcriptional regulator
MNKTNTPETRATKPCHTPTKKQANHSPELMRLRRLRGQIDGVERMIGEERYCVDILQQLKAVRSAVHALETSILKNHLNACVKEAFESKSKQAVEKKIEEIGELFSRR